MKLWHIGIEECFVKFPILEPAFLYGGYPFRELKGKTLLAKESKPIAIKEHLPEGLEYFPLKGHFFDMIGIKTKDDIYFLADSLFSEETIQKYQLFFIYDVKEYLNTLDYLTTLKGKLFIPSHCEATKDISHLIKENRKKVQEIAQKIYDICQKEITFEEILENVFDQYQLKMDLNQYVLVGSTIKSYLSYLHEENKLKFEFNKNKMLWSQN